MSGCAKELKPVDNLDDLKSDEIAIVTRVVLDPEPMKSEWTNVKYVDVHKDGSPIVHAIFYQDVKYLETPGNEQLPSGYLNNGEFKIIKVKKSENVFYYKSWIVLAKTDAAGYQSYIEMPGGLQFKTDGVAKVYYVGSLFYQRNKNAEVVGSKIVDEYGKAKEYVAKKLGGNIKVKKAILQALE